MRIDLRGKHDIELGAAGMRLFAASLLPLSPTRTSCMLPADSLLLGKRGSVDK